MAGLKRLILLGLLGLLATGWGPAAAADQVQVIALGKDRFRLVVPDFPGIDERAAQAMVMPTADQLCAGRQARFDDFSLVGRDKGVPGSTPAPHRFEQDISCVTPPPVVAQAPTAFRPTAADGQDAIAAARRFYDLRDAGDGGATFAMLSDGFRAQTTREAWIADVLRQKAPVPIERRFVAVSWSIDPPGVDPGAYVSIDFLGRSAREAFICGYVALKRTGPGQYAVVHTEDNAYAIPAGKAAPARQDLVNMIAALPCVVKPDPDNVLEPAKP